MLPIRLGTFLTEQESNQAKYYFNKPLIRLTAAAFMVFSISLAACMGAAAAYAHISKPSPIVSDTEYKQAQAPGRQGDEAYSDVKRSSSERY